MNKKTAILLLPVALLLFVLGFLITFSTSKTFHNLHYILVFMFGLIGIIQLFSFFWNKEYQENSYLNLIMGTIGLWFALFTLNNFETFITILPSLISIYSVVSALGLIIKYYTEKDLSMWYIIGAFISLGFAVILLCKPILMATIYIKLSGLYLISLSVYFLATAVLKVTEKN